MARNAAADDHPGRLFSPHNHGQPLPLLRRKQRPSTLFPHLPVPPRFFSFRSDAIRPAARCAPFRRNMTNRLCFCDCFLSQNCRFQETTPLVSLNDSIDFVQQSQWIRSTIPLILFHKTAVFISFIRHFSCLKVAFKIGSAGVLARCDYRADRTPALLLAVVFRFFLGSLRSSHLVFTSR